MSIYISVASYEDPFLERTIKSAFDNAANQNDLYFGVAIQNEKTEYPDLSFINKKNIITLNIHPNDRPGVVRLRYLLRKLMKNQDYFLQIDSHMLFEKNWDISLVQELNNLKLVTNKEQVIISKFLTGSTGKENEHDEGLVFSWIGLENINEYNFFDGNHFLGNFWKSSNIAEFKNINRVDNFIKTQYLTGQFIFSDKYFIENGSFDQYSDFFAEEPVDSIMAYLRGYDIYSIYGYNYISHNNSEYNKYLYGDEKINNKNFKSSTKPDRDNDKQLKIDFCKLLLGIKEGKFYIHDMQRTYQDFCLELGLDFESFKNNYYKAIEIS